MLNSSAQLLRTPVSRWYAEWKAGRAAAADVEGAAVDAAFAQGRALADLMARPPRQPSQPAIDGRMWRGVVLTGVIMAAITVFVLAATTVHALRPGLDAIAAQRRRALVQTGQRHATVRHELRVAEQEAATVHFRLDTVAGQRVEARG